MCNGPRVGRGRDIRWRLISIKQQQHGYGIFLIQNLKRFNKSGTGGRKILTIYSTYVPSWSWNGSDAAFFFMREEEQCHFDSQSCIHSHLFAVKLGLFAIQWSNAGIETAGILRQKFLSLVAAVVVVAVVRRGARSVFSRYPSFVLSGTQGCDIWVCKDRASSKERNFSCSRPRAPHRPPRRAARTPIALPLLKSNHGRDMKHHGCLAPGHATGSLLDEEKLDMYGPLH